MNEPLRQFILHFAPAALPGLLMLIAALMIYKPKEKRQPMTKEQVEAELKLLTRRRHW